MNTLQKIKIKVSVVAAVVLSVLAIASASAQPTSSRKVVDGIIVKVDNQIVLRSELEFAAAQMQAGGQVITPADKCQILQSMVINKMMLAKAERDSVVVSDDMVKSELDRRMAYFIAQIGSEERLEQYFGKSIKQLKDDLSKQVRDQLVMQKMQDNIVGKVTVTPREIRRYFNEIPKDSLPYFSTEVQIGQIVKLAQVSRSQKSAAREKLEAIRKRVVAGEDFQKLAKQYSEDVASAQDGGELGFFKKKELVPEYEAAALRLSPGELSPVVESQFGFHLIQMIERRGDEFNTRHILIKPASAQTDMNATAATLDSIRTLVLNDSMSFEKAAKTFSDDKITQSSGGIITNQNTGSTYIPLDKLDPGIFFTIDTMKVGGITPPLPYRTEDGKEAMRVIYLKSKTPPHQANLKDDYQKIAAAALNEKKNEAMEAWFEKNKNSFYIDIDPDYQNCNLLQTVY
ncbi:MAG: peptidylprolyl isomerase [Hymenobacteraceae bacterium]|nr:peptidylprolyl isomerase [Hymenobacteraceae bacterium]MDX5396441.1 peptidylprolyl isomerase [Hymenobacteraceae bacterium]MDX5512502.1 peptidylprolyl isomerase [Hymenobacteraceae bacterium]